MAFLAQAGFSPFHTPEKATKCSSCLYQGLIPWFYLGVKTLLHQWLKVSTEKAAFVHVWRTQGSLHSFCSAFYCWFPACFVQIPAGSLCSPSGLIHWSFLSRSSYQTYLNYMQQEQKNPFHLTLHQNNFCRHKRNS